MRTFVAVLALFAVVMSSTKIGMMSIIESELFPVELATHYENPFANGDPACRADEQLSRVDDFQGLGCFPLATYNVCPTDIPDGATAVPMPLLNDPEGNTRCALQCAGSQTGICAPGSVCFVFPDYSNSRIGDGNDGLCIYIQPPQMRETPMTKN